MQRLRSILATTGLALLLPAAGMAQTPDDLADMTPEERREYVRGLSDEERQALREQQRARRENMSDEEREAVRQQRKERKQQRRETWNDMTEEEKAAARQRFRDRRHAPRRQQETESEPQQ